MARTPKWSQGVYRVKNPEKYVGVINENFPKYRSSWETSFMSFCDNNDNIISWASEPIKIPYFNPIKQKQSLYIPDFIICYQDKLGNKKMEMIEIKPMGQAVLTEKTTEKEKADIIVNSAKWKAAIKFCKMRDMDFRILTKNEIYGM